jgi:hypothetical protein
MSTRVIEVVSGAELKMSPAQLIEVELRHNGQRYDVILDDERRHAVVEFAAADGTRDVEYRYRVHLRTGFPGAVYQFEAPPRTTDASILVINPREVYRLARVRAVAMFDEEQWRAAFVDIRLGKGAAPDVITLEVNVVQPEFTYEGVRPAGESTEMQLRIRHVPRSGEVVEGKWQPFDGTTVVVTNPPA